MKRLLTLIGLLSVLNTNPVLAQPTYATGSVHAKILVELQLLSITVNEHPFCREGLYGTYSSVLKTLTLCSNVPDSDPEKLETLVHESIHVIQDLVAEGSDYAQIGLPSLSNISDEELHIVRGYPPEVQDLELEAWAFEDNPELVLQMLIKLRGMK